MVHRTLVAMYSYGTFYSGSLGWNIAKEDFFSIDAVNDFKIRAAYGTVGNRLGIGRYASQGTVGFDSYPGGSATIPTRVANPELQWETTETYNLGLELNMYNKRVTFSYLITLSEIQQNCFSQSQQPMKRE